MFREGGDQRIPARKQPSQLTEAIAMKVKKILTIGVAALFLSACAEDGSISKRDLGTLLGAAAGAALGSQMGKRGSAGNVAAVAGMTLLGAYMGSEIGRSLDRADRMHMARATAGALENGKSGSTTKWNNPDSGHSGTVTPQPSYTDQKQQYCREFQQTVTIGGETETAYGTACRQPDGSWKIMES